MKRARPAGRADERSRAGPRPDAAGPGRRPAPGDASRPREEAGGRGEPPEEGRARRRGLQQQQQQQPEAARTADDGDGVDRRLPLPLPQQIFVPETALARDPRPVFPSPFDQRLAAETLRSGRTSKFRGVYWNKACKAWRARIWAHQRSEHLGNFDDEADAARAFDKRAAELGRKTIMNFPSQEVAATFSSRRKDYRRLEDAGLSHAAAVAASAAAAPLALVEPFGVRDDPSALRL